jgi:hypothetical protein
MHSPPHELRRSGSCDSKSIYNSWTALYGVGERMRIALLTSLVILSAYSKREISVDPGFVPTSVYQQRDCLRSSHTLENPTSDRVATRIDTEMPRLSSEKERDSRVRDRASDDANPPNT